jgi:hypothetical protein
LYPLRCGSSDSPPATTPTRRRRRSSTQMSARSSTWRGPASYVPFNFFLPRRLTTPGFADCNYLCVWRDLERQDTYYAGPARRPRRHSEGGRGALGFLYSYFLLAMDESLGGSVF